MTADERSAEGESHLRGVEERVRRVRHLEAFEYSEREDGRFHLRLMQPPSEMSRSDRDTVARLLSHLAEQIRED